MKIKKMNRILWKVTWALFGAALTAVLVTGMGSLVVYVATLAFGLEAAAISAGLAWFQLSVFGFCSITGLYGAWQDLEEESKYGPAMSSRGHIDPPVCTAREAQWVPA